MTKTSTIRPILSDSEVGLLPYLRHQLESQEFSKFGAQLSFQVEDSRTHFQQGDGFPGLQTTLSLSLQFLIILHSQIDADEATLLALELQEMLDACLVQWSQHSQHLLSPITEIKGSFGSVEEVRYHGGYLPGFSLNLKFDLIYSAALAETKDLADAQASSTPKLEPDLYSPGERAPQSGQYELTNPDGEGTGVEVTSTQGNPLPPTPETNQFYKLVDPTRHKKAQ